MKTATHPRSDTFRREYDATLSKLDKARDAIIRTHKWETTAQRFSRLFGDDITIVDLGDQPGKQGD
jgi:hypothetical protein